MNLVANNLQLKPSKQKMTKQEIIGLLSSTSNLMEEREDITEYINSLDWNVAQDVEKLKQGNKDFKEEKYHKELNRIAQKHGIALDELKAFVSTIISRLIFDSEQLTDLLEPLQLNWKARSAKEEALMTDLIPQLKKLANGSEISGLNTYEK